MDTTLIKLFTAMVQEHPDSAQRIEKHLSTNGLMDLDFTEFCQAMIDAEDKSRVVDGWVEEVSINITSDFFEPEKGYTADGPKTNLILTEQGKKYLKARLNYKQQQYWLGDQTHICHLNQKANRKQLPFDLLVRDKFDEPFYMDNGRHVNTDQSSPYRGGASATATFF